MFAYVLHLQSCPTINLAGARTFGKERRNIFWHYGQKLDLTQPVGYMLRNRYTKKLSLKIKRVSPWQTLKYSPGITSSGEKVSGINISFLKWMVSDNLKECTLLGA
jgi:hypothetical protein